VLHACVSHCLAVTSQCQLWLLCCSSSRSCSSAVVIAASAVAVAAVAVAVAAAAAAIAVAAAAVAPHLSIRDSGYSSSSSDMCRELYLQLSPSMYKSFSILIWLPQYCVCIQADYTYDELLYGINYPNGMRAVHILVARSSSVDTIYLLLYTLCH
jgi:hypothetical protein